MNSNLTQADFAKHAEEFFLNEVLPLLKEKGEQYSNGKAFTNFEEGSKLHDLTPGSYLMVMATKHWHNLCKKPDIQQSERIRDIIIYMLLLQAMYAEELAPVKTETPSFESVLKSRSIFEIRPRKDQ